MVLGTFSGGTIQTFKMLKLGPKKSATECYLGNAQMNVDFYSLGLSLWVYNAELFFWWLSSPIHTICVETKMKMKNCFFRTP